MRSWDASRPFPRSAGWMERLRPGIQGQRYTGSVLHLLVIVLGEVFGVFFGPRHHPPRQDMSVLGDISPRRS